MKQNKNDIKPDLFLPAIGFDFKGWETDTHNQIDDTLFNDFGKQYSHLRPKQQHFQKSIYKQQKNIHFTSVLSSRLKRQQSRMEKKQPNSIHTQHLNTRKDHKKILSLPKKEKSTPRFLQAIVKVNKSVNSIKNHPQHRPKNQVLNEVDKTFDILQDKYLRASQQPKRDTQEYFKQILLTEQAKTPIIKGKQFLFGVKTNRSKFNDISKAALLKKILMRVSQQRSSKVSAARIDNIQKREKSYKYLSSQIETQFSDGQLFQSNYFLQ